jgi:hypothetical protein
MSKFRYCNIADLEILKIRELQHRLDDWSIYTAIPFVTMS